MRNFHIAKINLEELEGNRPGANFAATVGYNSAYANFMPAYFRVPLLKGVGYLQTIIHFVVSIEPAVRSKGFVGRENRGVVMD